MSICHNSKTEQNLWLFQVFSSEAEGQYIDTSDENVCNWMMFLRPAKNSEEQNVVAFQFKGHIYCTTTKVWLIKSYC